jgi:hypothetical protein
VPVGPRYCGAIPDVGDARLIAAPSEFVALATRTAIDGPDDLDDVIAIQERLAVRPLSTYLGGEAPEATGIEFPPYSPDLYGSPRLLAYLNFLLQFHTVPAFETDLLRRLSRIGVGPYLEFDLDAFSNDVREAVTDGVGKAHAAIEERGNNLGRVVDGWQDIPPMGRYGDDYLFRSAVAWKFIYTNSPEEALYPIAETDAAGEPLTGEHRYVLRFTPGQLPPVDAFWSITLYDSTSRLMVDNPINRYSMGDRTPGLAYDDDGTLTIHIQRQPPDPGRQPNWLPAPSGRFYLNARAYIPRQAMLDGTYRLPAVQRVS